MDQVHTLSNGDQIILPSDPAQAKALVDQIEARLQSAAPAGPQDAGFAGSASPSQEGQFSKGLLEQATPAFNPMNYLNAVMHPLQTAKGGLDAMSATAGKAWDDLSQVFGEDVPFKERIGAGLQGARHAINASIPFIGPQVDKAQEHMTHGEGDLGAGEMAGILGTLGLGKLGSSVAEGVGNTLGVKTAGLGLRGRISPAEDIPIHAQTMIDQHILSPSHAASRLEGLKGTTDASAKAAGGAAPIVSPGAVTRGAWDQVADDSGFPSTPIPSSARSGMRRTTNQYLKDNPGPLSLPETVNQARSYTGRTLKDRFDPAMVAGIKSAIAAHPEVLSALENELKVQPVADAMGKYVPPSDLRGGFEGAAILNREKLGPVGLAIAAMRSPTATAVGGNALALGGKAGAVASHAIPAAAGMNDANDPTSLEQLLALIRGAQ